MLKMIGKFILIPALFVPALSFADCSGFEEDAQAFDAVVPKFSEDGSLRAMLMYGEADFIVPKRSLMNDARRKAQMRAKRNFTEFLQSNFSAETVTQNMINTVQRTDGSGNTAAMAEEVSSTLNTMKESSRAVLSGIVKLDECMDVDRKFVMVAMGWKPEYSEAAGQAAAQTAGQTADAAGDSVPVSKIKKGKGHRKKSKLADDFK